MNTKSFQMKQSWVWIFILVSVGFVVAVFSPPAAAQPLTQLSPLPTPIPPNGHYSYAVNFVCGLQKYGDLGSTSAVPGVYSTHVDILNENMVVVDIKKQFIFTVKEMQPVGREPEHAEVHATDEISLKPFWATADDCFRIAELGPGAYPDLQSMPLFMGYVILISQEPLTIDVTYTSQRSPDFGNDQTDLTLAVERVEGRFVTYP